MPINPKDDLERTNSQTESAHERGHRVDVDSRQFGAAETDQHHEGDIADEGPGHRDVRQDAPTPTPGSAEGERDTDEQSR
jgi:hypothetical protein